MPFLAKAWGWFTNNPIAQIITAFVLALIGWEVVKRNIQETGRIKERERIAVAQAAVKAKVQERSTEIIQEEQVHADHAIEARDREHPAASFDELSEPEKRVLDRRFRSGQTT